MFREMDTVIMEAEQQNSRQRERPRFFRVRKTLNSFDLHLR
jgi:hypothetical protein